MILATLNPRFPGQIDEGLWIDGEYRHYECYLVLRQARLIDWLRQEWDKGRSPDPDFELLENGRLRFYEIILLGDSYFDRAYYEPRTRTGRYASRLPD